jgi:PDDEXK-like domain of unknown function (DUF3799)
MEDFQKQLLGEKQDLDYFDIGNPEKIVLSSSYIKYINPEEGGSPKLFIDALANNKEKKNSISLERGTLLHDWQERRDDFIIADFEKPTDNIAKVIDTLFFRNKESFNANGYTWENLIPEIHNICKENGYGQSWKPDTLIKKIEDGNGKAYLNHLFQSDGKIAVTAATAEVLANCIKSINEHPSANKYLKGSEFDDETVLKEVIVIWKKEVTLDSGIIVDLLFKSKLDVVKINVKDRVVKVTDLKTVGGSVYMFYKGNYKYYRYYRQLAFYKEAVLSMLTDMYSDINPKEWTIECYIVGVETSGQFECQVFKVSDNDLELGAKEIYDVTFRVAEHIATSNWTTPLEYVNKEFIELELPEA